MKTKQLLLIDDDVEFTELLIQYLSPQGYQIDVSHDGESGLQKATNSKPYDLILLDVMLPRMDGFEVLKRLRLSQPYPCVDVNGQR